MNGCFFLPSLSLNIITKNKFSLMHNIKEHDHVPCQIANRTVDLDSWLDANRRRNEQL